MRTRMKLQTMKNRERREVERGDNDFTVIERWDWESVRDFERVSGKSEGLCTCGRENQ